LSLPSGQLLTTFSLSRDPLADIIRAIHQGDAIRFAAREKDNGISTYHNEVFQVEDYTAAVCFGVNQRFQLRYVFFIHLAA
jgi:hypothetical protein